VFRTTTSFDFGVDCARYFIAWKKFWRTAIIVLIFIPTICFSFIVGILIFKYIWDVIEHKSLTLIVGEHAAISAN